MNRLTSRQRVAGLMILASLIWCFAPSPAITQPATEPGEYRVLFVGNSLTFENNAAGQFEDLARQAGFDVTVELDAAPGAGLGRILANDTLTAAIRDGRYTHIILQPGGLADFGMWRVDGASVMASHSPSLATTLSRFDALAGETGTRFYLVETWASRDGGAPSLANASTLIQTALAESGLDAVRIPVGDSFMAAQIAGLNGLYQPDGIHPGPAGASLYAQLVFATLLETGLPDYPDHGQITADSLSFEHDGNRWAMQATPAAEPFTYSAEAWTGLAEAAATALEQIRRPAEPAALDWPELPAAEAALTAEALTGYWEGEARHHPQDWPWPAELTLNICPSEDGLRAELTYLFRNEAGEVQRRDHLHLPVRIEDGRLILQREGALWGSEEELIAVSTGANQLDGVARLLNPDANIRVEGHWTARRAGQSWTCFGNH